MIVHRKNNNVRVAIVTGIALAGNPRVIKEAASLSRAGYKVLVIGADQPRSDWESNEELARRYGFDFISVNGTRTVFEFYIKHWLRLRSWFGRILFSRIGIENKYQLGYFAPELVRLAKSVEADYYIVHSEQGLWAGVELLKCGAKVGVDFEDWYSEDLTTDARKHRPLNLLRSLEAKLLQQSMHKTCPSHGMSELLATAFECDAPTVIYNAFPWAERRLQNDKNSDRIAGSRLPSIHWFSQTVGPGRGLEDLFAALREVRIEAEIHLRGNPVEGFQEWLATQVPTIWRPHVHIHGLVSNEDLLSRISEHDIGFAGEMKYCRNKETTVSNKILYYLLGGLAVVASDTAGHCEIAAQASNAVFVYHSGDPHSLARQLNKLLLHPQYLAAAKIAALKAAEEQFCWERQESLLVETVERGMGH